MVLVEVRAGRATNAVDLRARREAAVAKVMMLIWLFVSANFIGTGRDAIGD